MSNHTLRKERQRWVMSGDGKYQTGSSDVIRLVEIAGWLS